MSKKKKLLIAGIAAAVLLIVIIVLVIVLSVPRKKDMNISFFYSNEDNRTYYLYGAELGDTSIEGTVRSYLLTTDQTVAVAHSSAGELWYISGNIAQSIGASSDIFAIAPVTGSAYYMGSSTLYRFDSGAQSSSVVLSNFSADALVSSPSGACVLSAKDGKLKLHDGQFVRNLVGEGMTPLGVSDSGDIAYAYSEDGCLYVYISGERHRVTSELSGGEFIFTADSESVIFASRGRLYVSEKGADKKLISEDISGAASFALAKTNDELVKYGKAVHTNLKSFENSLLIVDSSIIRISEDYEASVRIESVDCDSGVWSDGKNINYVKNGVLYSVTLKNITSPEALVSSVASFVRSEKDGTIYYIDKNGKLRAIKNGKISDVISEADRVCAKSDGYVLYLIGDELYATNDAKNVVMLSREVADIGVGKHSAYYLKRNDGMFALYTVDSGYKFKEIKNNISGRS